MYRACDCKTTNISQYWKPLINHNKWQDGFVLNTWLIMLIALRPKTVWFFMEVTEVGCKWFCKVYFYLCIFSLTQNILLILYQPLIWCNLPVGIVLAVKLAPLSSCLKKKKGSSSSTILWCVSNDWTQVPRYWDKKECQTGPLKCIYI